MNIPGEFAQAYNQVLPTLEKLKAKCDLRLSGLAHEVDGRPVPGRVKSAASTLLKTEKEGYADPFAEIDDLFAATIVVRNESFLPLVEAKINEAFDVITRVPSKRVRPETFNYDDLRFILKLKLEPLNPDPEIQKLKFELQVKTEMQAAASVATRDLGYKTKWLSWNRARWAARVSALIETVDELLENLADETATENPPSEAYELFANRNDIIRVLIESLGAEEIPDDRRRMAIIVEGYLKDCDPNVEVAELGHLLTKNEHASIRNAKSLSVTQKVFTILFREGKLSKSQDAPGDLRGERRFLITREMCDFCPSLSNVPSTRRISLSLK